jgi:hypothetical protein
VDLAVDAHREHADVVHRGDADPGREPAAEQRGLGRPPPCATTKTPKPTTTMATSRLSEGERHVVAHLRADDGEPEHRDEVHGPDAGADRDGGRDEPVALGAPVGACVARSVARSPSALPTQAIR